MRGWYTFSWTAIQTKASKAIPEENNNPEAHQRDYLQFLDGGESFHFELFEHLVNSPISYWLFRLCLNTHRPLGVRFNELFSLFSKLRNFSDRFTDGRRK